MQLKSKKSKRFPLLENSTGWSVLHNKLLYYCNVAPYEIRVYDPENGALKKVVFRRNDFLPPMLCRIIKAPDGTNGYMSTFKATSNGIYFFDNKIVHCTHLRHNSGTVIDFFRKDGTLLHSLKLDLDLLVKFIDTEGYLYGRIGGKEKPEALVKYRIMVI